MVIFISLYSKFVFRKISINSFIFNTIWVSIISPSYATFNDLMITCSSQVTKLGSNPYFFLNFKDLFDDFLQLLIFFPTKSFRTNTLYCWKFVLGINSCLYFCFFGSHLSKICAQLASSYSTSKTFLFTQKYLSLSIISTLHFLYSFLLIWSILYIHGKKRFFLMA